MPILTGLAIAGGLTLAGAGVEGIASDAKDAKDEATKQTRLAKEQQDSLLNEAKQKEANNKILEDETRKQQQARARQRNLSASSQGRAGTILTSPLGSVGSAPMGGGKTLLGT